MRKVQIMFQKLVKLQQLQNPSSVYKTLAWTGLEENNIEQPIEQHTSQENKERQSIPNKPSQPRNIIFTLRPFGKQNRAFNPKQFDQFKFLHYREDSDFLICIGYLYSSQRTKFTSFRYQKRGQIQYNCVAVLKESLQDAHEMITFIKYSPKRQSALQKQQE